MTPMKHKINPQIDCVFKALLGSIENKASLLDFLNSILMPESAIKDVEILNPYNEKEFMSDKLTIVDIKAVDTNGYQYQIELQMANYRYLPPRMLYMWSDIYGSQLKNGEDYHQLNPVISIWLLTDELFKDSEAHHHHFQLIDKHHQRLLSEHCSIHVIELNKWKKRETLNPNENWLYFLKEAKHWNSLPSELNTPVMRSAMKTLKQFSEKEREYHLYQSRQNAIRDELSKQRYFEEVERDFKQANNDLNKANHDLDKANHDLDKVNHDLDKVNHDLDKVNHDLEQAKLRLEQEKENSKDEIEALKARLRAAGLD